MLDARSVERVESVKWFARIDVDEAVSMHAWITERIGSVSLLESLLDSEWKALMEGASGDIQAYLFRNAREYHQRWNSYVGEASVVLNKQVMPRVRSAINQAVIPERVEGIVRWQLRSALIEMSLASLGVPKFFENILAFYEAGHLPCGWRGQRPSDRQQARPLVTELITAGVVLYL